MHGPTEGRDEGVEGSAGPSRPETRPLNSQSLPLSKREAIALAAILLVAIASGHIAVWVKLDAFQTASTTLVNTLDQARIKKEQSDKEDGAKTLSKILDQVQKMADKTDAIADETKNLANQILQINQEQSNMISELRNVTNAHTPDIKATRREATAAKAAAQRASIQSQKTQKAIAQPWYKRVFK